MSFKDTKSKINLEDLEPLEEPVLGEELPVLDAMNALEDEVALVEAENELDNAQDDLNEGEELAETADEEVAAAEEVVAEADAKAEETNEAPVIPVEDVVASQEALRSLIKLSGFDHIEIAGNRESIYNDSYTTYKQNLEGLKEVGAKIKETVKKIWEKIVEAFNWVVEQIKKVLPTKINRIKWLISKLEKTADNKEALTKAAEDFTTKNKDKFKAVGAIVGNDLENVNKYAESVLAVIDNTSAAVKNVKLSFTDDKRIMAATKEVFEQVSDLTQTFKIRGLIEEFEKAVKAEGIEKVIHYKLLNVSPKNDTISANFFITYFSKIDSSKKIADGSEENIGTTNKKVIKVTLKPDNAFKANFDRAKTINNLKEIVKSVDKLAAKSTALNAEIKAFSQEFAKEQNKNFLATSYIAKNAEKMIRHIANATISNITAFDGQTLGFALSYGKAVLSALNDGKKSE